MDEEDLCRFRSTFARAIVDAGVERAAVGEDDQMKRSLDDDYGTEITSLGSNTSWSASWSPLPAASSPQCVSPEPSQRSPPRPLSSPATSSSSSTVMRVQVESLTWQLNQMEVSYKMQRVVLEQIVTFLERLQTDLNSPNCEAGWRSASSICSKCGTSVGSNRRNSLESPTKIGSDAVHLNGTNHTGRPGSAFENSPLRDCPWRRRRRESSGTERIGSETYRLLRTVRSVLAATTPEPHQLLANLSDRNTHCEKTVNLFQQNHIVPPSISQNQISQISSNISQNASPTKNSNGLTKKEEEAFRRVSEGGQRLWEGQRAWGGRQNGVRLKGHKSHDGFFSSESYNNKVIQSSGVGQTKDCLTHCIEERLPEEEESGFSSIGSFHEGIKSEGVNRGSFHEVGLPACNDTDCLTVLWV